MDAVFLSSHALMGLGLAMDAFSVSLANGLGERSMRRRKALTISLIFALFQGGMPLLGWGLVTGLLHYFLIFKPWIPYLSLLLLLFLGGKMLFAGGHSTSSSPKEISLGIGTVLLQGIATSVDALLAGTTLFSHDFASAVWAVGEIFFITFFLCLAGVRMGKEFGTRFTPMASRLGGILLILMGIEIFVLSL